MAQLARVARHACVKTRGISAHPTPRLFIASQISPSKRRFGKKSTRIKLLGVISETTKLFVILYLTMREIEELWAWTEIIDISVKK